MDQTWLAELREQVRQLQKGYHRLERRRGSAGPGARPYPVPGLSPEDDSESARGAASKAERRKIAEDRRRKLQEQVLAEDRDSVWAPQNEAAISGAAADLSSAFPKTQVTSVDCASTLCKVDVSYGSQDEQYRFFFELVPKLGQKVGHGFRVRDPVEADGTYRDTMFFARPGHKLPK